MLMLCAGGTADTGANFDEVYDAAINSNCNQTELEWRARDCRDALIPVYQEVQDRSTPFCPLECEVLFINVSVNCPRVYQLLKLDQFADICPGLRTFVDLPQEPTVPAVTETLPEVVLPAPTPVVPEVAAVVPEVAAVVPEVVVVPETAPAPIPAVVPDTPPPAVPPIESVQPPATAQAENETTVSSSSSSSFVQSFSMLAAFGSLFLF